jgi:hypothetical protein
MKDLEKLREIEAAKKIKEEKETRAENLKILESVSQNLKEQLNIMKEEDDDNNVRNDYTSKYNNGWYFLVQF